ncbi:heme ABC transporter ATP-binding protein [Testudinibacter sp. TR-2022]|uniref:heme ABC transporter ATP-binding protein n=1 Tax=Testudinibacter sp. TR-2022 TaxID=2585029 RepID=UPI00111BBEFC|nr:heme ABC transporter ATP-binding protein [Testudinibacter sp. TR-2022]TNH06967.1 heme ABC transporter ATP-binding protein [Pasteurellaceae bacterium Phil11]TNH23376.1 heme ABC transporter ATP-binding protein [Testudinibacter sp. TR-2022]TNH27972.1 heme ABC transporter ATP-binding protein [Testudinibacter sp. TR-2022]
MLEISRLQLVIGKKILLNDINLNLKCGHCIGILGANGAGKSSLLKAIGQDLPYTGRILWQQKPLASFSARELAENMVFLPQHSSLNFAFTVQEVIELGLIHHQQHLSRSQQQRLLAQVSTDFELSDLQQQNYLKLSGGEKQRVHAARSWLQILSSPTPKIVLLDEPSSALDLKHQHDLLQQAVKLAETQHLVLIVLHDLNLAARYCDCLLLLQQGNLFGYGTTADMLTAQNIDELYHYQTEVYQYKNQLRIL